ncbi:MAG: DUF2937 family protein [Planctomycetota bacterium]|jgi:vacuolar-type H+-ATPase subunit H
MFGIILTRIFEYIRLALFLTGVLVGVQIPAFVDQYKKSVNAHLIEAEKSLGQFQADADKHFDGSIEKLIKHYLEKKDEVVKDGGKSITRIYVRVEELKLHQKTLEEAVLNGAFYVMFASDKEIASEVWQKFTFTVPLTAYAIGWGITFGIMMAMLGDLILGVFCRVTRLTKIMRPEPKSDTKK